MKTTSVNLSKSTLRVCEYIIRYAIAFKRRIRLKKLQISELERTIRQKEIENHKLERELHELHVSVSERKNISDVNGMNIKRFKTWLISSYVSYVAAPQYDSDK